MTYLHLVVVGGLSSFWNVFTDRELLVHDYICSLAFKSNEPNKE